MKILIIAAALAAAAAAPAMAQTNVSIQVGQPGFYGRIDLGGYAPPPVVYAQPVIIERQAQYAGQPVYLRVPPGQMRHWGKNCARYNACGQQVYFVRDEWYANTYAPRYRDEHRNDHYDGGHGDRRDHGDRGDHGDHGDHGDRGDRGDHGHGGDHGKHGD